MVTLLHLTPADYQISTWSGDQTTQLFLSQREEAIQIGPLTRASTATVEVEKSNLPISRATSPNLDALECLH